MAVGIIIGAAFSTIVKSLVDDIIMPPMGVVTGGCRLLCSSRSTASTTIRSPWRGRRSADGELRHLHQQRDQLHHRGLRAVVKGMNQLRRKQEEEPASEPPPSREVQLLEEIRDALVKRS